MQLLITLPLDSGRGLRLDGTVMSEKTSFASASDLPPGSAKAFEIQGKKIAVFNVEGALYAIDDTCPHADAPLSEGEVQDGKVTCPWHAAEFDLKTGEVLCPPAVEGVNAYQVTEEDGKLFIELS